MTTRRHLLAATSAGLALPGIARAQAEIRIRFAHSLSTTEPAHLAAEYFARNVAQRTNNRVRIEVFPGEQLGSGRDVNEMIRQGANVMNITDPGYLSDFVPDVGILNGPYLVDNHAQFAPLLASPWYATVDQRLQQAGFRMIMQGAYFGARHMIAERPIRMPADMAGMTVRVPPNQMWIETFRSLGARPTTVQWSEIYNALQQNVVQAAEAPYGSLWGARLQEVRRVISTTGHFQAVTGWPMNNGYFNRLPAEIRTILLEEGAKAGAEQTRLTNAMEADFVQRFRGAGVEIVTDVNIPAFREASAATYRAFPRWTPGLHETVRRILAA
ncbi:MAG: C4-dicarboxylate TRAP transporter substrate-binding protein [Roseococcus sp.]